MDNKLSPFKIALFGLLIILIFIAVFMFAFRKQNSSRQQASVTMWGTLNQETFDYFQNSVNSSKKNTLNIIYKEFTPEQFENSLIEALASGKGPDIVLLSEDLLLKHKNKLFFIGYNFYPQKNFKESFIESGESLLVSGGTWGIPFTIDPIVLYWNRTMLNSIGVSNPPKTWEEVLGLVNRLTIKDTNFNVTKSTIAFGEYENVKNSKEILITLMMQAGNPIVSLYKDNSGQEKYDVMLDDRLGYPVRPADSALNFYAQFSNPSNEIYTWNASLPNSADMFVSSDLAFYIGFASEYKNIKQRNPNLNFDVSIIPQSNLDQKKTYGKMHFLALTKNSPNVSNAFTAVMNLTNSNQIKTLSNILYLPPVKRDLLSAKVEDSVMQTFQESALISKGFLDPDPILSSEIFEDMIKSYSSGKSRLTDAILRADDSMSNLIQKIQ